PRPEGEARPLRTASRGRRSAMPIQQTDENYSATSIGSTITNLPIEPLFRNLIRPVILANKVSSLPRPTLSPGFTRVPRCRTIMVPPGTSCPPNALNPSRCALESRPFRDVPCPFLCAIKISSQWPVASFQFLDSCGDSRPRLSRRAKARQNVYFFFGVLFFLAGFFFAVLAGAASELSA